MTYPARHPDLFTTALSFSGAPDIAFDTAARGPSTTIINATETALDGVPANSMFGPRTTDEINWAAHDPATLAANLRGMNLLMYTGNGPPGPFDHGAASNLGGDVDRDAGARLTRSCSTTACRRSGSRASSTTTGPEPTHGRTGRATSSRASDR